MLTGRHPFETSLRMVVFDMLVFAGADVRSERVGRPASTARTARSGVHTLARAVAAGGTVNGPDGRDHGRLARRDRSKRPHSGVPFRLAARLVKGQIAGLVRTPRGKVRPVNQREVSVSEVDDFLAEVLPRQRSAEHALVNGDAGPRRAFWSEREPVTILGAVRDALNRQEVEEAFDWLEKLFSNGEGDLEVVAAGASGDMGYIVGYERTAASVAGEPQPGFELRVTLIFRREDGEWRAVHRHADPRVQGEAAVERVRNLANQ